MEAAAFSLSTVDHGLDDSALASISYGCKVYKSDTGKVDVNAHSLILAR